MRDIAEAVATLDPEAAASYVSFETNWDHRDNLEQVVRDVADVLIHVCFPRHLKNRFNQRPEIGFRANTHDLPDHFAFIE